jgi:trehalose 6-phosphate synthase
VAFVQVAVPSREDVAGYAAMREEIEGLAGRINGKHARLGQPAVQYRYGAVSHEDLVALYTAASAMIVTPLRDGMNLVAKEYVACHPRGDGFLVLSEFAGAALELHLAEIVNPYDPEGIADALGLAARAGGPGNARRMRAMHRQVIRHDVHRWARRALEAFVPDA